MKNLTIGIVAEGPTDIEIIQTLVSKIIPGMHDFLTLQPDISETEGFGSNGAGWQGVLNWCKSVPRDFGSLQSFLKNGGPTIDLLIIHIDADVSREPEIDCFAPCPLIQNTIDNLRVKIAEWLDESVWPREILCCIPADNMEAWIMCAFDVNTPYHNPPSILLECLQKPEYIISGQGYNRPERLLRRKSNGKPHKTVPVYVNKLIPKLEEKWEDVKKVCSQAQIFEDNLRTVISRPLSNPLL